MGYWCSAANRIACTPGTYNNLTDQIDAGACLLCPLMSSSPEASVSLAACVCDEDYYDAATAEMDVECLPCPVGSDCKGSGNTLQELPLLMGHYRVSEISVDLRECPDFSSGNDSACLGGKGMGELCAAWTDGPYCRLCNVSDTSRYYVGSECLPCESDTTASIGETGAIAVGALLALGLLVKLKPHKRSKRIARWVTSALTLYGRLSMRAKIKQMMCALSTTHPPFPPSPPLRCRTLLG